MVKEQQDHRQENLATTNTKEMDEISPGKDPTPDQSLAKTNATWNMVYDPDNDQVLT
jgi:hypothetical protein